MKVGVLTEFFEPNNSGVSHSVQRIVNSASTRFKQLVVISIEPFRGDVKYATSFREERDNFVVYRIFSGVDRPMCKSESIRYAYNCLKQIVKKEGITMVHAFCLLSSGHLAMLLKQELSIDYIISLRGNDLTRNYFCVEKRFVLKEILHNAKYITCVNGFLEKFIDNHFPQETYKCKTIYNSVNAHFKYNQEEVIRLREELGGENFVFSYIGDIKEKKQIFMLIDAFKKLLENDLSIRLLIIGEVYKEEKLLFEKMIDDCPEIVYKEKVDHDRVGNYLDVSHACVIPSYDDGLPNFLLESLQEKKVVIASEIFEDFLTHQDNALLFDPYSIESLMSNMEIVRRDYELRKRLISNSQLLLNSMLSINVETNSYLKLYNE